MKKLFLSLLSVVLLSLPFAVSAQCDCDFVISTSSSEWMFDGAAKGVKPGDKICFANGTRTPIVLYNINGTPENPVTVTNMCDGKVTIKGVSGNPYSIEVHKSSNFKVSGAGNASQQYGIELTGTVFGIDVKELSTDFEIDHLKLTALTDAGIIGKTDPTCDQSTWRGNFTMKNTKFHDNYIENIGGEGFYIGNSHYHTTVAKSCSGTTINVQEHEVINVQVYNNIVKSTGRDGIQVGGATSGCTIHHNDIYNSGTTGEASQNSGIQINPGTNADCYDNKVDTGTGTGIFDVGRGGSHIYNNLIMNQGDGGISAQDYPPVDTRGYVFANNTLINNKNYGMYMYSQNTLQNIFVNNIIVATTQSNYKYVALNNPSAIKWTASNNIQTADVNSIKFANAATKDYHLTTASALALNVGKDATANGVTADYDGTARPQGGLFDIGAFEFKTTTATPNNAPVANAGTDKAITLPTSSTTLTGSGTDSDGTIAAYAWTKVSGGAATLTNASSATLSVSALVAGTYTFRLTVTDNAGATATDDVVLTVNAAANVAPVASAGADKAITLPTSSTTIAGTGTDADGSVASYTWSKVSGGAATLTNATTATVTVTGLVAGTYTFRLTVKDNAGATGTDDMILTVNAAPVTVTGRAKFAFTNAAQGISGWNELAGAPHAAVISKTDAATGITVSSVATNQWNPVNYGTLTSSFNGGVTNGTVQLASVVKCNWFNYNAAYGASINGVAQKDNIAITGLNPTHKYKLQMGASRVSGAGTSDQYGSFEYRINGTNVKTLMVTNNATLQVEYTTISPDASGRIGISARKVAGSAMNFGYMGWLVITDETTGTTTARSVAGVEAEVDADTVATETAAVASTEEGFTFNDKTYAGTNYGLVVFNGQGKQIYAGEYKEEMYQNIFHPGELYVYHVVHEGRKVDTGKIFTTRQ